MNIQYATHTHTSKCVSIHLDVALVMFSLSQPLEVYWKREWLYRKCSLTVNYKGQRETVVLEDRLVGTSGLLMGTKQSAL